HVEADDDRVVDRGKIHIRLRDCTNTAVEDTQLNRIVDLDLHERLFKCLNSTRNVTLDDEVERLNLAISESLREVLKADALAGLRELSVTLCSFTLLRDLTCSTVFSGHQEGVAS